MNLTNLFIKNNRVTFVLLLLILLGGIQAYKMSPRDEDPEIIIRTALVQTYNPGMSPEEMELLISDKIEKKIQEMPEVDYVQSENRTGVSIITVEIREKYKNMRPMWDDLKDKVAEAASEFPEGASKPFVWDDFGDVFGIVLAITGDGFSYKEIKDIAEDLKKDLLLVPDVAKVDMYGVQDERIYVEVSNARLGAFGMTPQQLMEILADENIVLPGGQVFVGPEKVIIEPSGNYQTVDDIRYTVISKPGDLEVVYLKDIAEVQRGYLDPPTALMRYNGSESLGLAVSMSAGGNIVTLGENIKELVAEYLKVMPVGINIEFLNYQPAKVVKAISDFMLNLLQAVLIVSIVMILSLGVRTGVIVAMLIPMSILATFIFMSFFNINLQRVSIASLIIALGLMVDCGIVMSESIMVLIEKGKNRLAACVETGKELLVPLLTSTLTTCAAFLPIAMAKSVVGEYCLSLFQVVSISLLCSWFLGLTMIPLLCFYFLKSGNSEPGKPDAAIFKNKGFRLAVITALYFVCIVVAKLPILIMLLVLPAFIKLYLTKKKKNKQAESCKTENNAFKAPFYQKYLRFLNYVLTHRKRCLTGILVLFVMALWGFTFVKQIFFPPSDRPQFYVDFDMPEGTSIYTTEREVRKLEAFLNEQESVENFGVYVAEGGPRFMLSFSPEQAKDNYAYVLINCKAYRDVAPMVQKTREFLDENIIYGNPSVKQLESGAPVGEPVQVRISGNDIDELYTIADQIKIILQEIPGTYNIVDNWGVKTKKILVDVNQSKAKRVGLSSREIAGSLKMLLDEEIATEFREGDTNIPVALRSSGSARKDIGKLEALNVYSYANEQSIPLSQLASTRVEWENSQIYRRDRWRTMTISTQLKPGFVATDILKALLPEMVRISKDWPAGYKYELGGEKEESEKAMKSIADQLPAAVFIIIMLMVMQFNSIRRMVIIMFTIPMAVIGVTAGLLVTNLPFGFMSLLGYISLAGIVINNAIVLLDRININAGEGMSQQKAVILATLSRTRPIILTSITTVGGLIPLAVGGGEFWAPMAVTIMSGLIFATVLTLGFVPMLYSMFFKINYEEKDFLV